MRSCVSAARPDDGVYVVCEKLPPEVGALLMRTVEAACDALYREHGAPQPGAALALPLSSLVRCIVPIYTLFMTEGAFDRLARETGFDWDQANAPKILERHGVTPGDCEQVFFNEPLLVAPDARHSGAEERWAALGRTAVGRPLTVVFTFRGGRIRPISARDMSRKERQRYAQAEADDDADS